MNFLNIVEKHFNFLVTQFGYSQELISDTWIKYLFQQQYFTVAYDSKRSYEVIISFNDETNVNNYIPFNVLCLAYGDPEKIKQLSYFFSQQLSVIDDYLKKVSLFFQEKMRPLLIGNQNEIKRIQNIWLNELHAYAKAKNENLLRINANDAWINKQYFQFIKIMENNNFVLSELDKKKIIFAQKKIKNGEGGAMGSLVGSLGELV